MIWCRIKLSAQSLMAWPHLVSQLTDCPTKPSFWRWNLQQATACGYNTNSRSCRKGSITVCGGRYTVNSIAFFLLGRLTRRPMHSMLADGRDNFSTASPSRTYTATPPPLEFIRSSRKVFWNPGIINAESKCLGLRQDPPPPPPWFEFFVIFDFSHHGIEEVERHLLWKVYRQIQRKSWSNVPPKLLACIGFLYKVVHKIGRLRKFNRSREIEFNFLTAWTISMQFGTLVQHAPGYKRLSQIF